MVASTPNFHFISILLHVNKRAMENKIVDLKKNYAISNDICRSKN